MGSEMCIRDRINVAQSLSNNQSRELANNQCDSIIVELLITRAGCLNSVEKSLSNNHSCELVDDAQLIELINE